MKISFCTNVKDRLDHIKQTLPYNLGVFDNYRGSVDLDVEYCVCNYDSQDDLDAFLSAYSKRIKVKKVYNKPIYNWSNAKNCAHKMGTGDWLFNLDADNYISHEYFECLVRTLEEHDPGVVSHKSNNLSLGFFQMPAYDGSAGRVCVKREIFYACGGYDEDFSGWGNDDADIVCRIEMLGHKSVSMPEFTLDYVPSVILHSDESRLQNLDNKNKIETNRTNIVLSQQKYDEGNLVANHGREWGI